MAGTRVSEHFTREELQCRCGCGMCSVRGTLVSLAEQVRELLGTPMIVHSCCRCVAHNAAVGGTPDSQHVKGSAMDFHASGMTPVDVYNRIKAARDAGSLPLLGGLGLYDWGVHIDCRNNADGRLRTWDYRSKKMKAVNE